MAGSHVNRVLLVASGAGMRGINHMLNLMAKTARVASRDPDVRTAAEMITAGDETYVGRARAIHAWIVANIRYVPDPIYKDVVIPPADLLFYRSGDCDDMATLYAALCGSIGLGPLRFQAVGFGDPPFSHVVPQVMIGPDWITADTVPELAESGAVVRHYSFGEEPAGIQLRKTRDV